MRVSPVLLTGFGLTSCVLILQVFGGEEQLRQARHAAGFPVRVAGGMVRAGGIIRARILDLTAATLLVVVAGS
jgi:hypothetical protein